MTELKKRIKKQKRKICEVAHLADVSIANFSRYVNGWANPTYETARRIADAMHCGVHELWDQELQGESEAENE